MERYWILYIHSIFPLFTVLVSFLSGPVYFLVIMALITQTLVAAIIAFGGVQALPQSQATPAVPDGPVAVEDATSLFRDLFSAPTAIKRFQKLLVKGESLLTGDALRRVVVFDFNNATPAPKATGGTTKAAVSRSILRIHLISTNIS
jgi:hypothetical protein